jgi:hypothetical protein
MSVDATIALLDFDEYNLIAGVDTGSPNLKPKRTEQFINDASQFIADYCNRKFITPSEQITEYFEGDNTDIYYVLNGRIADALVTDIELAYRLTPTSWHVVDQSTHPVEMEAEKGYLQFFSGAPRNWYCKHKYGWARASIPADLKRICAEMVMRNLALMSGKEGLDSESFGDSSTTYNYATLPGNIKMVLDKYRMIRVG